MDLKQRKQWNEDHKRLTHIILKPNEHQTSIELFLDQHRLLHSTRMSNSPVPTLEDELFINLCEGTLRKYPVTAPDTKNSIVWHIWHITRIEDMTMNVLVNNDEQVLHSGQWNKKLNVNYPHSGNEMTEAEITDLSENIDIQALMAYRIEVGRKTREVVSRLLPNAFNQKVEAERIKILEEQTAVKKEASWLLEYWGEKTIAGLILMPATRHIFLHLNKSIRIKQRIQKKGRLAPKKARKLKMGIRSRIISHLSEGMINYPEINALWLEGADGTSTSDHLSDIDLVIHVNSGFETKALSICENLLEEIAALDLSYEEPRQHPNMRYKVFHLENTPSYLFIDVNVYSHRPYIEFDRLNDSEVPVVLFDKKQVIQIREHKESELKLTLRNRLYHLENTIKQKARIEKYIERNKFIEAIGYYHKFMISPLIEVLRIKYKPINHDYYIVCISKHLPGEIVQQLEELYKVNSIEDISKHTQQAYQWFYEVLKDVQNNLNK